MFLSKRKGSYICPVCYGTNVKIKGLVNNEYVKKVTCKKCGFKFEVYTSDIIDRGIISTIALLNKKGYGTIFSCAGHPNDQYAAYIYFRDYETLRLLLERYPLPDSWFLDERYRAPRHGLIIRSKFNNKSRLGDIYKWTTSLPENCYYHYFRYGYTGNVMF